MTIPDSYEHAARSGIVPLVQQMAEEALAHGALKDGTEEVWFLTALQLFASLPHELVVAMTTGQLCQAAKSPALQPFMDWMDHQACVANPPQPSIYVRSFVDHEERSMLVTDAEQLSAVLRNYANLTCGTLDKQEDIDAWASKSAIQPVDYHYVCTGPPLSPSSLRQRKLREFCTALDAACTASRQAWNSPGRPRMIAPLMYVGYAVDGAIRSSQHAALVNSSWLMGLVQAAAAVHFENFHQGRLKPRYHMVSHTVMLCFKEHHASYGEIAVSCAIKTYHNSGRGLAIDSAGKSVASIMNISDEQWELFAKVIDKKGVYRRGLSDAQYETDREAAQRGKPIEQQIEASDDLAEQGVRTLAQNTDNVVNDELARRTTLATAIAREEQLAGALQDLLDFMTELREDAQD